MSQAESLIVVGTGEVPRPGDVLPADRILMSSLGPDADAVGLIVDRHDEVTAIGSSDGGQQGFVLLRRRSDSAGARVLMVDDDEATREYYAEVLQSAGVSVTSVGTGEAFRSESALAPFDLYLIDVRLPDANGFELCAEVQSRPGSAPPVVLMSAYVTSGGEVAAESVGAEGFIQNPILPDALIEHVQNALRYSLRSSGSAREESQGPSDSTFSLRLFGDPVIIGPNARVTIPKGLSLNIVAALAAACPAPLSAEDLGRMASTRGGSSHSSSLHTAVSRLRQRLSNGGIEGFVRTSSHGYSLNLEPSAIDLVVFEVAARAITQDSSRAELEAALEMWGGNPLVGVDRPVLSTWQRRLIETKAQLNDNYALAQLRDGDAAGAELTAGESLATHRWREGTWVLRIVAAYRAGRQAEALAYQRGATRELRETLGLEAGEVLSSLDLAILTHDELLHDHEWLVGVLRGDRSVSADRATPDDHSQ